MSSNQRQIKLQYKANLPAYLVELGLLSKCQPMAADLRSLEFTESERARARELDLKSCVRFTIDFNDRCSDRFISYVSELYKKNSSPLYIWTAKTNLCGVFEIENILKFNFEFPFNVNQEGIVVLLAANMTDKLVLDFSYGRDSSDQTLEIDVAGDNWPKVDYLQHGNT